MQFNVGDRVRCLADNPNAQNGEEYLKVGEIYEVVKTSSASAGVYIDVRNDKLISGTPVERFVLVTANTTMNKISNAFKKFLNQDLRAQLKAGYRNGDLELTQEGKDVLLEMLADTMADKFTTAANEKIAEEEKKVV
jgi:hypothetical protein